MAYCILVFAALSFAITSPLVALQIFVDPINGDDRNSLQSAQDTVGAYKTITHALAVAHSVTDSRPHIIELLPGKYSPSTGEQFPLEITESEIQLRPSASEGIGTTVFDAEEQSNFFNFSKPLKEITIRGIDFRNGRAAEGGFASCNTCSLRVIENRFFNNSASSNGHVIFSNEGRIRVRNNIFRNNGSGSFHDTLGVIHLQNKSDKTSSQDEIRNNIFYRNSSADIWTTSTHLRVSGNIFIDSGSSALRNGSLDTTPFLDHNIFWQTDVLYISPAVNNESDPDSIDVAMSKRDTSFNTEEFTLASALKIAPSIKPLTFRDDSLSTQDLSIRIPSTVNDFPDTLIKVGQTHQYLVNVSGYPSTYHFKPLTFPQGLDTVQVRGQPRLFLWAPTSNDVGIHPIAMEITDSYGIVDTLSYRLSVFTDSDFPDTSSFRAIQNSGGRFVGMYRETYSHDVPHTAGERYLFDLEVWGNKDLYEFNPLKLPNTAFVNSVTQSGLIDWTPTAEDIGRHQIEIAITNPSGIVDTLSYNIFVFEDHAFPDTSKSNSLISLSLLPDTTNGLAQLNSLTPSFSTTQSAVGNLYANPVLLDTAYNRYELVTGKSPAINKGPREVSFYDKNGTRNDMGIGGGPLNSGYPNPVLGSEILITTKPDSILVEGQTFVYYPVSTGKVFTVVDLISDATGSGIPKTITPSNPFGKAPPIQWTPTMADTGKYILGLKSYAEDGSFGRHYFPIRVRPQNEIPYSQTKPDTGAIEDILYSFAIDANDIDGDNILYQLNTGPQNLSVDKNSGIVTWIPTQEQVGRHDITIEISDSRGATSEYSWSISVQPSNDAPVIVSQPDTLAHEDALFQYILTVSDPDSGDVFFPTLIAGPVGARMDSVGSLSWTPSQSQIGSHQIEIIVRDQDDSQASQIFSVIVTATNDAPQFAAMKDTTAMEDKLYEVALSATDQDDENLVYTLNNGPEGMVLKDLSTLSWLPEMIDIGSHAVNVSVTDPSGVSDTLHYQLHVEQVNDPPLITSQSPVDSIILSTEETLVFRVNVEDEEDDTIEYLWLRNGEYIPNAIENSLAFTPNQNQLDSISVEITDLQDTTSFTWHIDLRSMPRVSLSSTEIDFPRTTLGDTVVKIITVKNIGDLTLELDSLQISNPVFDAALSKLSITPGQTSELRVSFGPLDRGNKLDTVRFVSNDPDNRNIEITTTGNSYVGTTLNFDLSSVVGDQKARASSLSGGQTLGLYIYAYDAIDLQSFRITLEFDSSLLRFDSYDPASESEVNILSKNGRSPTYKTEFDEVNSSSVTLRGSIATGGISGDGLIGVANFTVDSLISRGTTTISMTQGLVTSDQIAIPDTVESISGATISLRPKLRGDFDLDLDVDFDDFFIFSDSFGQKNFNPLTDLNGDGEVSFEDFFLFSDAFGQATVAKASTYAIHTEKLQLEIERMTPDRLSLVPSWTGEEPTKGFVIGLEFDPNVLRFEKYVGRTPSAPLTWTLNSTPGHVIIAVGASSGQRPLELLGNLEFVRLSNSKTILNPILAIHYDGNTDATYHEIPNPLKISALPESFTLFPTHPNPFNPETTIELYAPLKTEIRLTIYDLLGQTIRTLVNGETLPGYHQVIWDGRNDHGKQVASGTYFLVMQAMNFRHLQKLLLLK